MDVSVLPLNNKAQLCGSRILGIAEVGGELLVVRVGEVQIKSFRGLRILNEVASL